MGAQPRYRSVKEDLDLLDSMLNRAASRSDRQRTGMLLYFKRNPEAPLKEAAAFLGVSVRNLQRWWQTYEAHGIAGLISAHLLPAGSPDRSAGGELQSELSISALVDFLSSFSSSGTLDEQRLALGLGLKRLLGEPTYVVIGLNVAAKLAPETAEPTVTLYEGLKEGCSDHTAEVLQTGDESRQYVAHLTSQGLGPDRFHAPEWFEYRLPSGRYLGTIVLLREKHLPPLSSPVVAAMRSLEPFLRYVLSCMIPPAVSDLPREHVLQLATKAAVVRWSLTAAEHRTMLQAFFGASAADAAARLGIAVSTYQNELHAIYRKSGCSSVAEVIGCALLPE